MKNLTRVFALSTIALALVSGTAFAADQSDCAKIMGFSGHTRAELFPSTCEHTTAAGQVSGKTREQVQAELFDAQRIGDIIVSAVAKPAREVYPGNYPAETNLAKQDGDKTREPVNAELVAAKKAGSAVTAN